MQNQWWPIFPFANLYSLLNKVYSLLNNPFISKTLCYFYLFSSIHALFVIIRFCCIILMVHFFKIQLCEYFFLFFNFLAYVLDKTCTFISIGNFFLHVRYLIYIISFKTCNILDLHDFNRKFLSKLIF